MSVTAMPKSATGAEETAAAPPGKSKKKLIIILVAVLALAGGGAYTFLKPEPEKEAPVAGEVVALDPIQINLADSHYLRVGIALQLTDAATHGADGSKALDATIDQFSGVSMEEIQNPKKRRELKKELAHTLDELYHHEVMEVYFTEFVTQ